VDNFIERFGMSNTGLGRILVKLDNTKIWRKPVNRTFERGPKPSPRNPVP